MLASNYCAHAFSQECIGLLSQAERLLAAGHSLRGKLRKGLEIAGDESSGHMLSGLTDGTAYDIQVGAVMVGNTYWAEAVEATPAARETLISATSLTVFENGGEATWTVSLSQPPSEAGTVSVTSSATGSATVSPETLNFA